jgi:transcriptional regulator with XRE-family HTH domain
MSMGFGERLTATRTERGLTQAELAQRSGVSPSYLGQLEAGRSQPTLEILTNLAVALAVSIDDLAFDGTERGGQRDRKLARLADAAAVLDQADRDSIANLIEALLYRHQNRTAQASRKKPGPRPKAG